MTTCFIKQTSLRELYENVSIWTNTGPRTGLKSQGFNDVISLFLIKLLSKEPIKSSVALEFKEGAASLDEVALKKFNTSPPQQLITHRHTNRTINEEQLQFGKGAGGLSSQLKWRKGNSSSLKTNHSMTAWHTHWESVSVHGVLRRTCKAYGRTKIATMRDFVSHSRSDESIVLRKSRRHAQSF